MKKYIFIIGIAFLSALLLTSCKTHEERVIQRLVKFSERVETESGKWDYPEWLDALAELEDIQYDMEDCDFSPEQLKKVREAQAIITIGFMNDGAPVLGPALDEFIAQSGDFMQGYVKPDTQKTEDFYAREDYTADEDNYGDFLPDIPDSVDSLHIEEYVKSKIPLNEKQLEKLGDELDNKVDKLVKFVDSLDK